MKDGKWKLSDHKIQQSMWFASELECYVVRNLENGKQSNAQQEEC